MAKHRVYQEVTECDAGDGDHSGDVETVEVTFRETGSVLEADLCGKHRTTVTIADIVTIGHTLRRRKPADRPIGLAGMPDMFRPE
jgi:hypothetical protein